MSLAAALALIRAAEGSSSLESAPCAERSVGGSAVDGVEWVAYVAVRRWKDVLCFVDVGCRVLGLDQLRTGTVTKGGVRTMSGRLAYLFALMIGQVNEAVYDFSDDPEFFG